MQESGVWVVHKGPFKYVIYGGDEQLAIEVACIRWNEVMPYQAEEREFEAEMIEKSESHATAIALEGWLTPPVFTKSSRSSETEDTETDGA